MTKSTKKITGISLPVNGFRVHETFQSLDMEKISDVLNGNLAAYRVREFMPLDACRQIVDNFWSSKDRVARVGYGEDGVEGYFIGASHIEKTTHEYLEEVRAFEKAVNNLYSGTMNPASAFREALASGSKLKIRPAQLNEQVAGHSKAVYWNSLGDFLLQPHDDLAQLSDPRQNDFEIQQGKRVMAVNIYAEVPIDSGQLKIWNIEPDNQSRDDLNLTHSGFPYPAELLDEFDNELIPVATGDLCIINGNLIHAVIRGNATALSKNRLLITFFMTLNNQGELIWWT